MTAATKRSTVQTTLHSLPRLSYRDSAVSNLYWAEKCPMKCQKVALFRSRVSVAAISQIKDMVDWSEP